MAPRLEHADDRRRSVSEPDGLADDRGSLLSAVVQKRCVSTDGSRRLGPSSVASSRRPSTAQSHHVEVGAADDPGADHARFAQPDHREPDRGEVAEGASATSRAP